MRQIHIVNEWMDGLMDGLMDEWIDEWIDEWMDRWMEKVQTDTCICRWREEPRRK